MENEDQILSGCFVVDLLKIWHENAMWLFYLFEQK